MVALSLAALECDILVAVANYLYRTFFTVSYGSPDGTFHSVVFEIQCTE